MTPWISSRTNRSLSWESVRKKRGYRDALYLRDNRTCVYCLSSGETTVLTLDHITPRCRGGSNTPHNLVSACRSCNSSKNSTPLEEWGTPEQVERVNVWTSRFLFM